MRTDKALPSEGQHSAPGPAPETLGRKEKHILVKANSFTADRQDIERQQVDLWLVFRNGHETVHLGPAVICSRNIDHCLSRCLDFIDLAEEALAKGKPYGEPPYSAAPTAIPGSVDYQILLEYYQNRLTSLQKVQSELEHGHDVIISEKETPGCPDIFVKGDRLSKELIEVGLAFYLRGKGYLPAGNIPKFYWQQRDGAAREQ